MPSSSRRRAAGSTYGPRSTTAWPRSPSPTPAWASHRRIRRRSSRSSGKWGRRTRRSRGPGSAWPCPGSSSSCTGAGSGSRASQEKGRRSCSPFRSAMNELILIVEDNPKNLKLVRDTLQVKGYHTIEAETGEEGVQLARERRPGPDSYGHSAARHERDRGARGTSCGFQGKPISVRELLATVRGLLERS